MQFPYLILFLSFLAFQVFATAKDFNRRSKVQLLKSIKERADKPQNRRTSCLACTLIVDGVQTLMKENSTEEEMESFMIETCDFLKLEPNHYICENIVNAFLDEVLFVLARTLFTPDEICGAFIQDCGQAVNPFDDMWPLTIPDNKPPVKPWADIPANFLLKLKLFFQKNKPTYRFLHLSDIHIDRKYAIGSEADCKLDDPDMLFVLCCRNYSTDEGSKNSNLNRPIFFPAGKYGSNGLCDLPYETFEIALRHISQAHTDVDYIIITGDFEAHDPWDNTVDLTRANIENITAALLKYFPKIPIYICIGNHEAVPEDAVAPHTMPEYDTRGPQSIYEILKNMWSNWIPPEALPDVQYRASYSTYIKPNLKLISINSIYCSNHNFYVMIDQRDPDSTLEWLIEQLSDSESKNEKVHIIGHIASGSSDCLKGWSWNFVKIINRYENTISALFFGHSHRDEFEIFYDNSSRPFHVNWLAPSLTTNSYMNPAYRIYTIDGSYEGAAYTVKEAETYSTNLALANKKNEEPIFSLEYIFSEEYEMKDLSPQSFSDLSDRLLVDDNLFSKYMQFLYRTDHGKNCLTTLECRQDIICGLKSARNKDKTFCPQLNSTSQT